MAQAVGEELRKIKENLRIDVKALLCSSKDGLTERELKNDYRNLIGADIPFARLGYRCLYDLMKDMPNDVSIKRHKDGYTWIYYGIHDETTRDLGQLVSGQLDKNKSVRDARRARENRFRPTRLYGGPEVNTMPSRQFLPSLIQSNIEKIMKTVPQQKISLKEFELEYIKKHTYMFNYKSFGYTSLKEALESLNHLVKIETNNNNYDNNNNNNVNDVQISLVLASQQDAIVQEDDKIENKIQYVTLEEEIVFNLVKLIEEQGEEGVVLSQLPTLYKDRHNISLKYERFGYSSFDDFVYVKLDGKVSFIQPKEKYSEIILLSKKFKANENSIIDNNDLKLIIDKKKKERTPNEKLKSLKKYIKIVFSKNYTKKILVDDFPRLFELKNGWTLNPKDYDSDSLDELYKKLCEVNIINIIYSTSSSQNYDENNNNQINTYLMLYKNPDEINGSDLSKTLNETICEEIEEREKTIEEKRLIQAKFMLDYVFYNNEFDYTDTLKPLTAKETHKIRVSNVTNPADIQIHLVENINRLDELMDDLETLYHGIGSSSYDMPAEYVILGRICAAIYPGDNNWHRCVITGVVINENKCRVEFIDYGGSAYVSMNSLKFLDKRFAELPVQAINARLHDVKEPTSNRKWSKDIIGYLLNLTMKKDFEAKIYGFNEGKLSVELFETTENGILISLNKRVIQASYGSWYDSTQDIDYEDYETWREEILSKKKSIESDVISSTTNTSTEHNNNNNGIDYDDVTDPHAVLRRKEKRLEQFTLRSLISSANEIDDNTSNTDELTRSSKTNHNNNTSSHLIVKYKTTTLKFLELNTEMQIYLFQINNEKIYLHSSDIIKLFGFSVETFKAILPKYINTEYLELFKYNDYNKKLFSIIEKDLKLDTKNLVDDKSDREIVLISYKYIVDFASLCLGYDHGKRIENCLNHRKQRARKYYAENRQLYNEDKLDHKTKADNYFEMADSIHNDAKVIYGKLRNIDKINNKDEYEKVYSDMQKNEQRYNHYMSLYFDALNN